jgi:hypothetical protein
MVATIIYFFVNSRYIFVIDVINFKNYFTYHQNKNIFVIDLTNFKNHFTYHQNKNKNHIFYKLNSFKVSLVSCLRSKSTIELTWVLLYII